MSKKLDLTGQTFGRLVVLNSADPIIYNEGKSRSRSLCKCECGKAVIILNDNLRGELTKSCGCLHMESISGLEKLPVGSIFNNLTILGSATPYIRKNNNRLATSWCLCVCGNIITAQNYHIKCGKRKSCGCIKIRPIKIKNKTTKVIVKNTSIKKERQARKNYDPMLSTAKRVYRAAYSDADLTFDDFLLLSQQNCFYCGISMSNRAPFKSKYFDGYYLYNGLDRINSKIGHTKNNVVACCILCNFSKGNKHIEQYKTYIYRLTNNIIIDPEAHRKMSDNIDCSMLYQKSNYGKSSVKEIFNKRKQYCDGDLSLEIFYRLTQLNCYYCGLPPSNSFNCFRESGHARPETRNTGNFTYNGLDRVDNSILHNYNNVVAACKNCNFSKGTMLVQDFFVWIDRLRNNYHKCQIWN